MGAPIRPPRSLERGVVYIATGAPFVRTALASARSVRRIHPELAIALFTDAAAAGDERLREIFDVVRTIANPHYRSKVDHLLDSPFERSLYLDADTRAVAPFADVLDVLDRFDVALAHAHTRNRAATNEPWRKALPRSFPQFNGGLLAYRRSPQVERFLADWRDSFHSAGFRKDQVTLRELLWESGLRIATLPPEYNLRRPSYLAFWKRKEAAPRILHLRAFARDGAWPRLLERLLRALAARPWQPSAVEHGAPQRGEGA